MFKTGDRAYSMRMGWGIVRIDTKPSSVYVIDLISKGRAISYLPDGREYEGDAMPSLYHAKPEFEIPPEPNRYLDMPVDTKLIVGNGYKRYFSHFKHGSLYCFDNGGTSWSSKGSSQWPEWRLADEG